MTLRFFIAAFVVGAVLIAHSVTSACSRVWTTGIERGMLGHAASSGQPAPTMVPRNVAVIEIEILEADDVIVPLEPVSGTTWSRPAAPLPAGAVVRINGIAVTTTDVIDEAPPSAPGLVSSRLERLGATGCGRPTSDCTGSNLILLIEAAADDQTPEERITYALYGGATADGAATATSPIRLLLAESTAPSEIVEVWDSLELEAIAWVALAAVDQAGNLSARTAPVSIAE